MNLNEFLTYAFAGLSSGIVCGLVLRAISIACGGVFAYSKQALRE